MDDPSKRSPDRGGDAALPPAKQKMEQARPSNKACPRKLRLTLAIPYGLLAGPSPQGLLRGFECQFDKRWSSGREQIEIGPDFLSLLEDGEFQVGKVRLFDDLMLDRRYAASSLRIDEEYVLLQKWT